MISGIESKQADPRRETRSFASAADTSQLKPKRRRRYLVDSRYQLRTAVECTLAVCALLVLLNLAVYFYTQQNAELLAQLAPELEHVTAAQQRILLVLALPSSAVLVLVIFGVAVLRNHRTAGPVLSISRQLRRLRDGHYDVRVRLRHNDNLKEIENEFNKMIDALRSRMLEEVGTLRELATRIGQSGEGGHELAVALENLAEQKRRLLGD